MCSKQAKQKSKIVIIKIIRSQINSRLEAVELLPWEQSLAVSELIVAIAEAKLYSKTEQCWFEELLLPI